MSVFDIILILYAFILLGLLIIFLGAKYTTQRFQLVLECSIKIGCANLQGGTHILMCYRKHSSSWRQQCGSSIVSWRGCLNCRALFAVVHRDFNWFTHVNQLKHSWRRLGAVLVDSETPQVLFSAPRAV